MLKTGSEIARLKGVSKQAVNNFILKKKIPAAGKKGKYSTYDTGKEPLASYLSASKEKKPEMAGRTETPETSAPPRPKNREAAVRGISKPLNDLLAGKMPPGQKPAAFFYSEALKLAKENHDAGLLFKLAQIAAKEDADEVIRLQMLETEKAKEQIAQERAESLRIENEISRGRYLDRATVKLVFGKQYAIDTSVLIPLGLKLADMIDSLPEGPGRRGKIQKLIDDEIFSALENKKRLLAGYIEGEKEPA